MDLNIIISFSDLSWDFADDANIDRCSVDEKVVRKKHKTNQIDDEAIPSVICEESTQESIFKPLHIVSEWTEPCKTSRSLSLAVLLPPGALLGKFLVVWQKMVLRWSYPYVCSCTLRYSPPDHGFIRVRKSAVFDIWIDLAVCTFVVIFQYFLFCFMACNCSKYVCRSFHQPIQISTKFEFSTFPCRFVWWRRHLPIECIKTNFVKTISLTRYGRTSTILDKRAVELIWWGKILITNFHSTRIHIIE